MDFRGPERNDFDNVQALNRAFLQLVAREPAARRCLRGLPPALARGLQSLSPLQMQHLCATPFLLLSFRERDDDYWDALLADKRNRDLFAGPAMASPDLGSLVAAGLSFVWQLARQNPYAARLICGASLNWCEQLAERPILEILATAGRHADVLALRCAEDTEFWNKLLNSGISREPEVRQAAHISALQAFLTRASTPHGKRWATAARAVRAPTLRVADDDGT